MPALKEKSPWLSHVGRWKDCQRCGLCDQRTHIVLGKGSIPCDVLFIGEAPGESENVLGQPFVGPAGQLLDHVIRVTIHELKAEGQLRLPQEGFERPAFAMAFTNLVACFPAEAKKTGNHEPRREEIEACLPRLREFIKLVRPILIVCVGSLADRHAPEAISEATIRGDGEVEDHPTLRRWATILHPAAILRMPVAQQDMAIRRSVVQLKQAMEEAFSGS